MIKKAISIGKLMVYLLRFASVAENLLVAVPTARVLLLLTGIIANFVADGFPPAAVTLVNTKIE